ncbi:OB-fold-containig protein, partial [Escherichia coli]|uniref:OB-fold-containig protein n=1 Tax=Escherichia coli TaxID=562 RepID=UPI003F30CBAC
NGGKNSLNRLIRCVCGKKIGPDPRNFNQRVCLGRNDLLIRTFRSMALITGHQATSGNPCEGKLTDQFGQIHYLLLEPEEGKFFTKGDKVLIICRLSATRYLAENNPWPQIL